jgi:hypothetical protein
MDKPLTFNDFLKECAEQGLTSDAIVNLVSDTNKNLVRFTDDAIEIDLNPDLSNLDSVEKEFRRMLDFE